MPFVKKIETEAGILGIWELQETYSELAQYFNFSETEKKEYQQIRSNRRKAEYLSTRLLIQILMNKKIEVQYKPLRRPTLKNESLFISISHSNNLVAVLISPNHSVGVDAESIDRNIDLVAKRFLSPEEAAHIEHSNNPQKGKIIYWCAKESIFKCTHNQGIQFNEQISIVPFHLKEEGYFSGILKTDSEIENFKLWYFTYKNNMIVYCVPL